MCMNLSFLQWLSDGMPGTYPTLFGNDPVKILWNCFYENTHLTARQCSKPSKIYQRNKNHQIWKSQLQSSSYNWWVFCMPILVCFPASLCILIDMPSFYTNQLLRNVFVLQVYLLTMEAKARRCSHFILPNYWRNLSHLLNRWPRK